MKHKCGVQSSHLTPLADQFASMDGEILANGSVNVLIFRGYLVQLHTFDQALTLAVVVVVCVGGGVWQQYGGLADLNLNASLIN